MDAPKRQCPDTATRPGGRRRRTTAFTLAELILAMAVTSVIAVSVAATSMVLSTGAEQATESYDALQASRVASRRISEMFRDALLVTAVDDTRIVLWAKDRNGDGQINLSEITLLRYDSSRKVLTEHRVVFPSDWSEAYRAMVDYSVYLWGIESADSVDHWLQYNYYCYEWTLAENVASPVIAASGGAPPFAQAVSLELTVGDAEQQMPMRAAGRLRMCQSGRIATEDGWHTLSGNATTWPATASP